MIDAVKFYATQMLRAKVQAAFRKHRRKLAALLPAANIQHIGSTAIPGTITKGDLDIVVRVRQAEFRSAEKVLAQHYTRNTESHRSRSFASFKNDALRPPLGIQLVVIGGATDDFLKFRDRLAADGLLILRYNALKRRAVGLSMAAYRRRKGAFIQRVLARRQ